MNRYLIQMYDDPGIVAKIKNRLPYLYQLAEVDSSRAGRIGMEVGSLREKILIALLIYVFGESNVNTQIPITQPEVDVELFGLPISIKTITSKALGGVKLSWTVDAPSAQSFLNVYKPSCDILFVQIVWGGHGGMYYLPVDSQILVLGELGRERYIVLPKSGTNPRGVEISKEALTLLVEAKESKIIDILWQRSDIEYNPYKRWIDLWGEA